MFLILGWFFFFEKEHDFFLDALSLFLFRSHLNFILSSFHRHTTLCVRVYLENLCIWGLWIQVKIARVNHISVWITHLRCFFSKVRNAMHESIQVSFKFFGIFRLRCDLDLQFSEVYPWWNSRILFSSSTRTPLLPLEWSSCGLSYKYGIRHCVILLWYACTFPVAKMAARRSGRLLFQRCIFCARETLKRRRDFDMRQFSRIGNDLFVTSSRGGIFFASGKKQLISLAHNRTISNVNEFSCLVFISSTNSEN